MSAWRSYILGPNSGVVSNYWWVDCISFANSHWLLVVCQSSLRRITTRPDKEEDKGNDTQVSPDVPDQFLNGNTRQRAITPPTSDSWENGNKHQHGVAARTGQPRKNPISAEIDRRKSGWLATEGIWLLFLDHTTTDNNYSEAAFYLPNKQRTINAGVSFCWCVQPQFFQREASTETWALTVTVWHRDAD